MSDEEFNQKTKEYRKTIEYLMEHGFFDLKTSGSATLNFKPDGSIQNLDIRVVYAPPKI